MARCSIASLISLSLSTVSDGFFLSMDPYSMFSTMLMTASVAAHPTLSSISYVSINFCRFSRSFLMNASVLFFQKYISLDAPNHDWNRSRS